MNYTNDQLPVLRPASVNTDDSVLSVNGLFPDATGNVTINVGVMTINHIEPDSTGNVDLP